ATFFAGGGPAVGLGQKTKTGVGKQAGTWVIHEGVNAFGGAMGLLGQLGARVEFTGYAGTYVGTGSWDMIRALGRVPYAEPTAYRTSKPTNWLNPHLTVNTYTNHVNSMKSKVQLRGSGTPWTTGSVTLYAREGIYTTILHRAGYDTVTPGGVRNLQLVTPALTHWIGPGWQDHTGHIGILTLQVPEPGRVALFAAGIAALLLLHRASRRL
ncbi:MAG: PEP-CTERM sorting domain-containing protein, partial [Myxococcales bacterium]|nr:PEP-CTERM sorting domain-containing protein [Myxococcales bacterium]